MTQGRGAVFLDRDGVLNERPPPHRYVTSADEFRWLPGAAEAVARLTDAGLPVVVVSNQRGVARGIVSRDVLAEIEGVIQTELGRHGSAVTGFYYCLHDLGDECDCRKPAPGLLLRAARDHVLSLRDSVMIGDSESDVEAGRAVGCRTIRVGVATPSAADVTVTTLAEAASFLLHKGSAHRTRHAL